MLFSWGLLAFLKATDTRPKASFANALYYRIRKNAPVSVPESSGEEDDDEED